MAAGWPLSQNVVGVQYFNLMKKSRCVLQLTNDVELSFEMNHMTSFIKDGRWKIMITEAKLEVTGETLSKLEEQVNG